MMGAWDHHGRVFRRKHARASPRSRGGTRPPRAQTEKPCAAESGPTLGGDRARIARGRPEARVAARFRSPTTRSASNEDIDARTRTHGDGDGGRLLGELNTLHTRLGHDLHGAGLGGGAGGAGRGGGADGGDERNLGDSHFSWMCSCVYENGYRAVGPPVWIAILSGPCWSARISLSSEN